jgi:hypothetical protein
MKLKHLWPAIVGVSAFALLAAPAVAGPAIKKDLAGKKVCWSSGSVDTFSKDGKYASTAFGGGTWEIGATGVQLHTDRGSNIADIEKMPDGTLQGSFVGPGGRTVSAVGKYCN